MFLRAHGVALVATVWLLALVVGLGMLAAIAIGLPLMCVAFRAYVSELRDRRVR